MGLQIKFTVFASLINFCVSLLGPASVLSAQEFENQSNSIFRKHSILYYIDDITKIVFQDPWFLKVICEDLNVRLTYNKIGLYLKIRLIFWNIFRNQAFLKNGCKSVI